MHRDTKDLGVFTLGALFLAALVLLLAGCAPFHRCHTRMVPMYWVDGTVSLMEITTCRY